MHTAVGVDRAVGRDAALSANFVRVRGRNQLGTIDYNPIVPALGPGRRPNDVDGRAAAAGSARRARQLLRGLSWRADRACQRREAADAAAARIV
jgi:hypothetical protein